MFKSYKSTIFSCYIGYITQAIAINFIPLLYLLFSRKYSLSLGDISLIPGVLFIVQIVVDIFSTWFVNKIGYRAVVVLAHIFSALGLALLGILPDMMSNHFLAIIICVIIFSSGCAIIEVLISPLVEACPTEEKSASMGFLHSFYSWGQAVVILFSTIIFSIFGLDCWKYVAFLWALIPAVNAYLFCKVPIYTLEDHGRGMSLSSLFKNKQFYILILMMICSGAAELSVAQWASAFAEDGLHITKSTGDIAGPCIFAVLMGISRIVYAKYAVGNKLKKYFLFSSALCVISYILITCQANPVISLIGCALCGFSVGVMWPGTYSIASESLSKGGTQMFSFLALAGDMGCTLGVVTVGYVSEFFGNNIKMGILCASIFPILICLISIKMIIVQSKTRV